MTTNTAILTDTRLAPIPGRSTDSTRAYVLRMAEVIRKRYQISECVAIAAAVTLHNQGIMLSQVERNGPLTATWVERAIASVNA